MISSGKGAKPECRRHNKYVAGHILELDEHVMLEGTEKDKQRHIVETAQTFALEFAGNVIGNVDRVINVNMEIDLPQKRRRRKKLNKGKAAAKKRLTGRRPSPSIRLANAPGISRIDLELIDKKEFFEKFFDGSEN